MIPASVAQSAPLVAIRGLPLRTPRKQIVGLSACLGHRQRTRGTIPGVDGQLAAFPGAPGGPRRAPAGGRIPGGLRACYSSTVRRSVSEVRSAMPIRVASVASCSVSAGV